MKKHVLHQQRFDEPINVTQFGEQQHWLLPQLLAFIGSKLPLQKNSSNKLSFKLSLQLWKTGDLPQLDDGSLITITWIKHAFELLNTKPRGNILGKTKQATLLGSRYAANVPLILSAFKEYRNIDYAQWDFSEPEHKLFLDPDLLELLPYFGEKQTWSKTDLLEFQRLGRTVQSGANKGKVKSVEATTSITGVPDPEFKQLPRLMKLLLTQVWVYAPHIRNKYAITNLEDLDLPAAPLVDAEIFTTNNSTESLWQ